MARSIAIVEDEPAIRANYVEALNRFGYQTQGYASRPDASRAFAQRMQPLEVPAEAKRNASQKVLETGDTP